MQLVDKSVDIVDNLWITLEYRVIGIVAEVEVRVSWSRVGRLIEKIR